MRNKKSDNNWAFENLLQPLSWIEVGNKLVEEANKLEPEAKGPIFNRVYFMLVSYALENYYKAAIISLNDNYIKAIKEHNIYDIKDIRGHDLVKLACKAGLYIKGGMSNYLTQLTEYVKWRGRYPSPLAAKRIGGKIVYPTRGLSAELSTTITTDVIHELISQAKNNITKRK